MGHVEEPVHPRAASCGTRRQCGQVLKPGIETGVIPEVFFDRAVRNNHPDILIGLESMDVFLPRLDHFRPHHIDRWVVDGDAPIAWRASSHANLLRFRLCVHLCEFGWCVRGCHAILLIVGLGNRLINADNGRSIQRYDCRHLARTKWAAQLDDGFAIPGYRL